MAVRPVSAACKWVKSKEDERFLEMKRKTERIFVRVIWIILFTMTSVELFHIFFTHAPFPVSQVLVQIGAWLFALAALAGIISLIFALRKSDR